MFQGVFLAPRLLQRSLLDANSWAAVSDNRLQRYHAETYNAAPAAEAVTATLMSMHVAEVFTGAYSFFFFVQDYRLIAVWPLKLGLFRISHLYYKANAQLIYGATAINSERVIAWKAIIKVEAAGLRGSGCCCETINLLCLVLCIDIDNHSFCCNIMWLPYRCRLIVLKNLPTMLIGQLENTETRERKRERERERYQK